MMVPVMEENSTAYAWPIGRKSRKEDEAILAEARSRFIRSPYHELHDINCDFREGVLILRGRVPSYFIKQVAQSAVFSLEDIAEIDNRLEVIEE
jgi:hypothetical protein